MKTKTNRRRKPTVKKPKLISQKRANADRADITIREISKIWVEHWNAGRLEKVIATYASDASYVSPGRKPMHGRDAIREYLQGCASRGASDLAVDVSYVKLHATCAWDIGTYRMHISQRGRKEEERGQRLTIWQRTAGKWLIMADAWFSDAVQLKSPVSLPTPELQSSVEQRLTDLQSKVGQLLQSHFIQREFRPDLSTSALPSGPDQKGRSKGENKETKEVKEKDLSIKESEKLTESAITTQASRRSLLRVFAHSVRPLVARSSRTDGFDYLATKRGQTRNFNVYYGPELGVGGAFIADAVLSSCEDDYHKVRAYFGGIAPSGLPFNIIIAAGIDGAYHRGCRSVDLYCDADTSATPDVNHTRMLMVAEVVEVFCATQNAGWDCGASNGEGLSRVLAADAYPAELNGFTTAASWLDSSGRPDWINSTAPTDGDAVANGCSVLFLNYLHSQLDFGWDAIVQAGAPTLAETYESLTGKNNGFDQFSTLLQTYYPLGTSSGLTTDNPFPLGGSAVALQEHRAGQKNMALARGRRVRSRVK